MSHPLDGSREKIRRARQHLGLLDEKTRSFADTEPYGFLAKFDPKARKNPVRVQNHVTVPPSPDLSLIVGDAIHNLRSALDHLVFQLAEHGTGAGRRAGFPIFNDPKDYRGQEKELLRGVPERHRTRIEGLQPYHIRYAIRERGPRIEFAPHFSLLMTNRLDNWDKHRLLLPIVGVAPTWIPVIRGLEAYEIEPSTNWVRMEQDAILCTIVGGRLTGDLNDVKVEGDPPYTIVFGDPDEDPLELWGNRWKGAVSLVDLRGIATIIEGLVDSFDDGF